MPFPPEASAVAFERIEKSDRVGLLLRLFVVGRCRVVPIEDEYALGGLLLLCPFVDATPPTPPECCLAALDGPAINDRSLIACAETLSRRPWLWLWPCDEESPARETELVEAGRREAYGLEEEEVMRRLPCARGRVERGVVEGSPRTEKEEDEALTAPKTAGS